MLVQRVYKIVIKPSNPFYEILDNFCFKSKNLYNQANYIIRECFEQTGKWVRYSDLDKVCRANTEYPDYKNMPTQQSAQQTLRLLDKNWISFFKQCKQYSKNKSQFTGQPKFPKYKNKNGRFVLTITNQEAKVKNGFVKFPKTFNNFILDVKKLNIKVFNIVRFIPKNGYIVAEIVYETEQLEKRCDNHRYFSVDIGLDNLLTVGSNVMHPFVLDGQGLKSINQYYNKSLAKLKSIASKVNKTNITKRIARLHNKRNFKVEDYLHKVSKLLVKKAIENNVNTIVIGLNKDFKRNINIGKINNQKFTQIPFNNLINKIKYKAESMGLNVVITEEQYTSGTSFLDNEQPVKTNYNKSRRKFRGLFVSNLGIKINADVNQQYQILKKVFPNVFDNGIEGVVLHPVVLTI